MDPWSINTASQTSWPPFLFCTHLFLIFWQFFFFSIVILNSLMYNLNPKQSITIVSTIPFLNIYFPDFLAIFLDFLKHFLWLDLDPEPWTQPIFPDFLSTKQRSFQNLYAFVCLYWKPMLLPSCHPKLSFCIHQIPAGCWWRSWWNRCLNVTGTIIYFYFVSYQAEEGKKF